MPDDVTNAERLARLETQMETAIAFGAALTSVDRRVTRVEKVLIFVAGIASVSGVGSVPTILSLLNGG